MPTRENLFQLIKLLSADEKKYFVKTLGKHDHSDPVLLHLFKDLSKARSYQPDKLGKKYKSLRVLLSKLKRELLEAMRVKRLDKDIDNQIFCHLKDYQFFYEKGFLKSATKALEEAKKLSVAYEKTGTTLQIVREEIRLRMERRTSDLKEVVLGLIEEKNGLLVELEAEEEAVSTYYRLFAQFRSEGKTEERIDLPYPHSDQSIGSFYTRVYRHNANVVQSRLVTDYEQSRAHLALLVQTWRKQKLIQREMASSYRKILGNYATFCIAASDFNEALKVIEEIEKIPPSNFNDDAETFQAVAYARLVWALNVESEIDITGLLDELSLGLETYDVKINPARKLAIWYNMFLLCLFRGHYDRSRHWMEEILSHKKFKVKKAEIFGTRLLRLLLEYDCGDYDQLDNVLTSTYVLFHRNNLLDDFSSGYFRFFKAVLKDVSTDHRSLFMEYQEELEAMEAQGFQPSVSGIEAVRMWIKHRIGS